MEILPRLFDVITAPARDFSMIWEVAPLIITLIIVELYFGHYKEEELGWNSALSNSLVLVWIGINLLHYLFLEGLFHFANPSLYVAAGISLLGISLAYLDYHHFIPRTVAWGMSSGLPVNIMAYFAIVFVHGQLILDFSTLFAALIIFCVILVFFQLVQLFEAPEI